MNQIPTTERGPYSGASRKLVIALDVGTTYSGASYSILDPGEIPQVLPVTKFPSQAYAGTDCKTPSIIYYDRNGVARAFAAQALEGEVKERAKREGWVLSRWFKLHLRPRALSANHIHDNDIPKLPPGKTAIEVFSDFLGYLYKCTREYIEAQQGRDKWNSFGQRIDFVLSHPNGWEGAQQSQMRRAAVLAGLIPGDPQSESRLQFVTEGEASLHFCFGNTSSKAAIKKAQGVIMLDAGGGTIDLSAYRYDLTNKSFEEIAVPECRLQGAIFVVNRARTFLEGKLRGSRFCNADDIDSMVEEFDKGAKMTFRDSQQISYIKFGGRRDNDASVGITDGEIKLKGTEVADLFKDSVDAMINAIQVQRQAASYPITTVLLVGGFSANDWLYSQLKSSFKNLGLEIVRPDRYQNKAVSDGAVSFYLDSLVYTSIAQWTFGINAVAPYDSRNYHHIGRSHTLVTLASGEKYLPSYWSIILMKGTRVHKTETFRETYDRSAHHQWQLNSVEIGIKCYRGSRIPPPSWIDEDPDMFPTLCKVVANTSAIANTLPALQGSKGIYYRLKFDVVLEYGLREHKAHIAWQENGKERTCEAVLVYVDF